MWLSSVLSGLMLTSFCLAEPQVWDATPRESQNPQCGLSGQSIVFYERQRVTMFPWMIVVLFKRNNHNLMNNRANRDAICGGSLIHYKAVLTLASCVQGKRSDQIKVRAGKVNFDNDGEQHQDRDVVNIVTHPAYDLTSYINDFAILVLREPFRPAANVIAVCLPKQDEEFVGSICAACGFGIDESGERSPDLLFFEAPIESPNRCTTSLSYYLSRKLQLHSSFICTKLVSNGQGVCTGGPLTCLLRGTQSKPRFVQTGVISQQTTCGETVSVYSNVANARDWIDATFQSNGIEQVAEQ